MIVLKEPVANPTGSQAIVNPIRMPLQIRFDETDGITILRPMGRLVFGEEASALQDAVETLLSDDKKKLIISLKDVPFIDSTGLGVLVVSHSASQKANATICLLHLSKRHMELLILAKLNGLFQIFDDETAAVDSFFPEREVKHFDILEFVKSQEKESDKTASVLPEPNSNSK